MVRSAEQGASTPCQFDLTSSGVVASDALDDATSFGRGAHHSTRSRSVQTEFFRDFGDGDLPPAEGGGVHCLGDLNVSEMGGHRQSGPAPRPKTHQAKQRGATKILRAHRNDYACETHGCQTFQVQWEGWTSRVPSTHLGPALPGVCRVEPRMRLMRPSAILVKSVTSRVRDSWLLSLIHRERFTLEELPWVVALAADLPHQLAKG